MALEHFEMLKAIEKQFLCKFNITYEVPIKHVIYWYLRCSISFALICAFLWPFLYFHFQVIKFLLHCFPHTQWILCSFPLPVFFCIPIKKTRCLIEGLET